LKKEKRKSPVRLFLEQFTDILIIILLIATALSMAIGEVYDAIVIIAIVIACAVLGFFEEYRAEKALEALKKMTAPTATVLRNGKEVQIQTSSEVVPGDILLLYTGDKVPADARLIEAVNMKTDEAPLTGESTPVNKNVKPLPEDTPISDRRNMVFTGTVVVYGRGKAVVTSTGMNTEFGKIAKMVQTVEEEETPLEKRMAHVGKWLGILSVAVCLFVAVFGIIRGRAILDMILWGISLAVAAVPEALPAVVTGALAVGMYRMAKENAIVRRLPAVETLGCTSIICSDKTGTMTKGEMTVERIYVNGKAVKVTGVGYEPQGDFLYEDKKLDPAKEKELQMLLKAAVLCNDSKLEKTEGRWTVKGDPTEGALVVAAAKAGLWKEEIEKKEPRINEIPFSSERKRMTTVHESGEKKIAYMKGAPEIVLERCTKVYMNGKARRLTSEIRKKILAINEAMAVQALRNLGFAYKELPESKTSLSEEEEEGFVFLGIMGMIDPPREEVKDAIYMCRKAGIKVVMVTGDHKLTAVAVAKELNLIGEKENEEGRVLTGAELDKLSDEEFEKIVENVVIYARVSPEHKVRIVKALRKKGYICAMTGDGVNDAPALKMADIGVAMGITGTEVTKEASDMVLTDDNFATIVRAVKEGREIYDNIKKYLTYLLRCNIMEILVLFIAMMFSREAESAIALTTIQILWINLTTDGLPAIALGVDPGDPDLMERKPRNPKESIFTTDVKIYLSAVPILMTILLLGTYFYTLYNYNLMEARTQLFTSIVLMELANAVSARSLKYTVFKVGVFKNKFLWVAILSSLAMQLAVLYIPGVQGLFDVTYPDAFDWIVAITSTLIVFFSIETGKYIASKRRKR